MEPQNEAMELTDEEKKKILAGQCNYLLLTIFSFAAFVMGQNASYSCAFAIREVDFFPGFDGESVCAQANLTSSIQNSVCKSFLDTHGVGFYNWLATVPIDTQVCVGYTQPVPQVGWVTPDFDSAFNAAKVFSVMANVFGAFGWFSVIFATCCPVSQDRIAGLSCYFSLACICQSFTFLLYASDICEVGFFGAYFSSVDIENAIEDVTCSLGNGAKLSITAAVLYAVCSSLAPISRAPAPIRMRGGNEEPVRDPPATGVTGDAEAPAEK